MFLSEHLLCLSWATFKSYLIFMTSCSISISSFIPSKICSLDYPRSLVSYTSCHTKLQMDSWSRKLVSHCYMQTLSSVDNLPTWTVCPSHTCEACLQELNLLFMFVHLFVDGRQY